MNRIFNPDNVVFSTLSKLVDIVALSILWAVFSIPIVTIGASTSALYYTMTKTIRNNRGYVFQSFWRSFKSSFKQGLPIWIGYMIFMMLMYSDASISGYFLPQGVLRTVASGFFFGMMVLATLWVQYVFPYIARFSLSWKGICKNCGVLAVKHLPFTILLLLIEIVIIGGSIFFPIIIFFAPSLWAWLSSLILEHIFAKYMTEEDRELEEERNSKYPRN